MIDRRVTRPREHATDFGVVHEVNVSSSCPAARSHAASKLSGISICACNHPIIRDPTAAFLQQSDEPFGMANAVNHNA